MEHSFVCPSCGGQLEVEGSQPVVKCPYCGNSVPVPEELLRAEAPPASYNDPVSDATKIALAEAQAQAESQDLVTQPMSESDKRWLKIIIVAVVLLVVVPTCIGIFASIFGVIVGVAAPIIAVIVQFFAHR